MGKGSHLIKAGLGEGTGPFKTHRLQAPDENARDLFTNTVFKISDI